MLITEIKSNPNNPRLIKDNKFKQLVKSIQDFPQMLELRPIVIDEHNMVLGGNMRLKACLEAGLTDVPVIHANNLSEEKKKEFIVKDNVGYGEWDWDDLANNWDALELTEWGLDIPNFDAEVLEAQEDNFAAPEGGIETDIVLGDLFEIGEHRLLCGDSNDLAKIEELINNEPIGMIFTDPPYGIGIDGQKESKASNPKHNRKNHEFMGWDNTRPSEDIFQNILALNVPTVIFGGNYFADILPASRGWIYWSKGQDGLTMSDGELAWTNLDKPLRCVTVNRANIGKSVHPTQKPIQVVEFGIKYATESGSVLDLFGGSGSTMAACHNLKRKNFTMELEPKYCQVIIDRMRKLDPDLEIKKNGVTLQ
jgi:DNA modification methylase